MKIQFNSFKDHVTPVLEVAPGRHFLLPVLFFSLLIVGGSILLERMPDNSGLDNQFTSLAYRSEIRELSKKIAVLDGESQRLKSFAQRMAEAAEIDISSFAFEHVTGRGGGDYRANRNFPKLRQLNQDIEVLDDKMLAYSSQLERIQLILKSRVLESQEEGGKWPVTQGYLSSGYGWRKDPFTGDRRKHRGIDIAAKLGTPVMSVAEGKVTFVGRKGGYGRVVEVDHGEGVVSRYAHLDAYLVSQGDKVKVGQKIAKVGSSGRSTGPHLHLEIIHEKQHVDPAIYLEKNASLLSVKNK